MKIGKVPENVLKRFVPCHYGDLVDICDGVKIRFTDKKGDSYSQVLSEFGLLPQ